MMALRRSRAWSEVLRLFDKPQESPLHEIAAGAMARQYDQDLCDSLLKRLVHGSDAARVIEYADLLARVYKKPGRWVYWGYRPAPRPANEVVWEMTEAIGAALNNLLSHTDRDVRLAALRVMRREKAPGDLAVLAQWLREDRDAERAAAVLDYLRTQSLPEMHRALPAVIGDRLHTLANRRLALSIYAAAADGNNVGELLAVAAELEDGALLAQSLRLLGAREHAPSAALLLHKTRSGDAQVRAAAIEALGALRVHEAEAALARLFSDNEAIVRLAAARAAGALEDRESIDSLLKLATDGDAAVRAASLDSLRALKAPDAVPLATAALGHEQTERSALECLKELGGPKDAAPVVDLAKRRPSLDVLMLAAQALTQWRARPDASEEARKELDEAMAGIHGASGNLVRWHIDANSNSEPEVRFATGAECRVVIAAGAETGKRYVASTEIAVGEPTEVEFLASASGAAEFVLNGKPIHRRDGLEFRIDSDRFVAMLNPGTNQLELSLTAASSAAPLEFQVRFRRKSAIAEHERLAAAALAQEGDATRGRELFFNAEKSQCVKCHRVADQGERIGPDLTGVASRFSRIYIIESILTPGRAIASSFHTQVVSLESGQVLTGVKIAEDDSTITLADNQGQKHVIAKATIEDRQSSPLSTMPDGLEKRIGEAEFVDLVAYLASLKE
jgi:putative heme-binding domain-containing protein